MTLGGRLAGAWRLVATLLLLAYIAAAWGSGLDRLTRIYPALQEVVPAMFRAEAARQAAGLALERGEGDAALAAARQAVDAEPAHPMSTALLGAARQMAGNAEGADQAFRVAGKLGWRAGLTQLYWYEAAVRSSDWTRAALRADAILRVHPALPLADQLLAPLEANADGRAAIAQRLALAPDWLHGYFRFNDKEQPSLVDSRAQVAMALATQGSSLGCKTPAFLAARLLERGQRALAEELWRGHCGDPGTGEKLSDGQFVSLAAYGPTPPFGWIRHSSADLTARLVEAGETGGVILNASNFGDVSRLVLSQSLALRPGRYRFFADVQAQGRPAAAALLASLDCGGSAGRPRQIDATGPQAGQVLEAGACPSHTLGLWLQAGARDVQLGNLRIERAD